MNSTMTGGPGAPGDDENNGRCELLGPFALFVQGALGALALLSLVWKRSREHPQRPLLIWFFDASKQVWGSILVHIANLLLSMLSSGQFTTEPTPKSLDQVHRLFRSLHRSPPPPPPPYPDNYHANPCSFYLLNLAIDTTIGIFILIVILRVLHKILLILPFQYWHTGISSGDYGDPPRWSWWGKQAIIYFCGLMGMKFVVWIIFQIFPWLGRFGDWLLGWTEGDKRVQVFFVMFFFPLVMNAVQYYIIDSYIKAKPSHSNDSPDLLPPRRSSSSYRHSGRHSFDEAEDIFSSDEDSDSTDDIFVTAPRTKTNTPATIPNLGKRISATAEYNPDVDGINPSTPTTTTATTTGAGSKTRRRQQQYPQPDSASSSTYNAIREGRKTVGKRDKILGLGGAAESLSSIMLLPGSRGPSTPGYADDENSSRKATLGSERSGRSVRSSKSEGGVSLDGEDDDDTLVGRDEDADR